MELLKVFVGDGSSASTIAGMAQGDLLLVKASDNSVLTASTAAALTNSDQVRVVSRNSKGLVYSTPLSKNDVIRVNYTAGAGVTQKVMTATLADIANNTSTLSKTYSLGVQIKEDLRMGTYNKNTEIIVAHTTPSSAYIDAATAMEDICSTLAKGFAANPLTSSGSPSQLVRVERTGTGSITALGTGGTTTFAVTQGARQVTASGNVTVSAGTIVSIAGILYLVETGVTAGTIFTLDTAYQGSTASVTSGTTSSTFGTVAAVTASTWAFRFSGVAQTRSNRFDQYRVTDFEVIYPKGFDAAGDITIATSTALVYGRGTWAQVRDMEERSFSHVYPTVNYREFPFSDYELNSDLVAVGSRASTNYNLFTLVHNAPAGYNYMQSSGKTFPQVTVVAAPTSSNDGTVGSNDFFGSVLTAWWSADSTPTSAQFA
jgi:hypothetical protein